MGVISVALPVNPDAGKAVILPFDCEAAAAVGDVVYQDPTTNTKVLVNTNNTITQQSIGIIKEKTSTTTCNVIITGIATGFSSLTRGGKIYLSTSGGITQTEPASGNIQQLGIAITDENILVNPSWEVGESATLSDRHSAINIIDIGENVIIEEKKQMFVFQKLTNSGTLTINGQVIIGS